MYMNDAGRYAETPMNGGWLLLLAVIITAIGSALAYVVAGQPPLIGIDDAAITRNYAENLANGHGIVYYVGGERVEGSTSFLWTLVVAVAYVITPTPEMLIIGIAAVCTAVSVFAVLSLAALLALVINLRQRSVVVVTALGLLGLPGFFFWSVFTMMELALWSAVLLVLVWRLARLVEKPKPWCIGVILAAFLLPLIRPEGIAVALGLLVLAGLLMWRLPRGLMMAMAAALIAFAGVTAFRLVYFGYPVPNTFYAKVSSDRLQDLIDGAKYLFSFIGEFPFAETFLVIWVLAMAWALGRLFSSRSEGAGGLLIAAAALAGIFSIYTALGGDHFAYWRFFQPATPLLPIAPALLLVGIWWIVREARLAGPGMRLGAQVLAVILWAGVSYGEYRQARFDLKKEFTLVEQGLEFGELMNGFEPRPVLGVGPAGGIALGYDGPILDLLGLNWVEMAHANPIKTGMRNHASFDAETFWKHQPDLIAEFNRKCSADAFVVYRANEGMTKGMYLEDRFQKAYAPVRIRDGNRCWRGFARRDWLSTQQDARIETVEWSTLEMRRSSS